MKTKYKIVAILVLAGFIIYGFLYLLKDNISFHYEDFNNIKNNKSIYIGGVVDEIYDDLSYEDFSYKFDKNLKFNPERPSYIHFKISGKKSSYMEVFIPKNKILPLFRKNQGVIIRGSLYSDNLFFGDKLMIKHDETYKN